MATTSDTIDDLCINTLRTRYVGVRGAIIGVDRFGASAPGPIVMGHYGFTVEHVVATAKAVLGR